MADTPEGPVPPMAPDQVLTRVVELLRELEIDIIEVASCILLPEQAARFCNLYELVGLHDEAREIDAAFEDTYEPVNWETERPDWEIEDLKREGILPSGR